MDWLVIAIYFILVFFGWLNIYAAVYDPEMPQSIFNFPSIRVNNYCGLAPAF